MNDWGERINAGLSDITNLIYPRRRHETEGQRETARETGVMLGLMADAKRLSEEPPEEPAPEEDENERLAREGREERRNHQRMMLARALPGMRAREAVLLAVPNRSLIEENELLMIRREMARIEGRPEPAPQPVAMQPRRFAFLAPVVANPLLAALMTPWTLVALLGAFLVVQMGLKERIENQRDEARRVAEQNAEAAEGWRDRAEEYRQAVVDAAAVARHAADALEAERQRQARANARERRRNREIQDVLAGSPEPPAWRLRDTEPSESDPAAPDT